VKIPRFESRWHALKSEEEALSRFNDFGYREEVVKGKHIFIEEPYRGRLPDPRDYRDNSAVIDWLVSFQSRSRTGIWRKTDLERRIASVAEVLSELQIADSLKLRIGSRLRTFAASAIELNLCICSEHGDFATTNMMLNKSGSLWVTDWEFFEERGDPFFDLSMYLVDGLSHGGSLYAFGRELTGKGEALQPIRVAMDKYSSATGIPLRTVFLSIPYAILRCLQRQLSSYDSRQLSHNYYADIILLWDKVCGDNQLPPTL
jgi:aminoglycoside phosphotransferase (APT) family kinase protein